jgi:AraC-like DNA-binding protein
VQHVEFIHREHFETRYYRQKAGKGLSRFIDFFWEIDFDPLWDKYPGGFSDALFPNIGYTYMINLGTPFVMELGGNKYEIRSDAFLPRHKYMVCHHSRGNKIFGIKFKVSPVIFEKKVNFSEYREYIFPLAYLIDNSIVEKLKGASSFHERVQIISGYYARIIERYSGSMKGVEIVTEILKTCSAKNEFDIPIEIFAARFNISPRTLQRYFTTTTSISCKQALQILRIRKAVEHLTTDAASFHYSNYGYFDYSHFYKHIKAFLGKHNQGIVSRQP